MQAIAISIEGLYLRYWRYVGDYPANKRGQSANLNIEFMDTSKAALAIDSGGEAAADKFLKIWFIKNSA